MPIVRLSQRKLALVDTGDLVIVSKYKWFAHRADRIWYAVRHAKIKDKWTIVRMHREILNAKKSILVDHRNGNGLDNRRSNLRIATHSQNNANRMQHGKTCHYKGVRLRKIGKWQKWIAQINAGGKKYHLGCFTSPKSAARAYDRAAIIYFGEFARINLRGINAV